MKKSTKKLNILMINDEGYRVGGAAIYTDNLAQALRNKGHVVEVLSSDIRYADRQFWTYTFPGHDEHSFKRFFLQLYKPSAKKNLIKIVKKHNPDIIHIHSIFTQTSASIFFGLKEKKAIMTLHDNLLTSPYDNLDSKAKNLKGWRKHLYLLVKKNAWYVYTLIRNTLYHQGLRNVDAFICPSNYICREMKKEYPQATITLIPNSTKLFSPMKIRDRKIILFVGRLAKEKGVEVLLQALPLIRKKIPAVRIRIVGDGAEMPRLKSMVRDLGIEQNVDFLGYIPPEEMAKQYQDASIVCIPSIGQESFSLVGIEAMSAGRPIIASNVGGISDWLKDGITGYLVPPNNASAIARRTVQLFAEKGLLTRMSQAAVHAAKRYDMKRHVQEVEATYWRTIQSQKWKNDASKKKKT